MQVFKFGGAALQSPQGVQRAAQIIRTYHHSPLVVVVSAMGKTTALLERICYAAFRQEPYAAHLEEFYVYHNHMIAALPHEFILPCQQTVHPSYEALQHIVAQWYTYDSFGVFYDAAVAYGELTASQIALYYLKAAEVPCTWVDARRVMHTDAVFRSAHIQWEPTLAAVKALFSAPLSRAEVVLTQGFIGSAPDGRTTTLGKEGSDFTGSVLAAMVGAEALTVWKDVPGIMSADPRLFEKTFQFDTLSYHEMAEMSSYGAKVIHPKTIHPLASHDIPLRIRSFNDTTALGTHVHHTPSPTSAPLYILRENQCLIHLESRGFDRANLQPFYAYLNQESSRALDINLWIHTGRTTALCIENDPHKVEALQAALGTYFNIISTPNVVLLTIKNYQGEVQLPKGLSEQNVLLSQQNAAIYQAVLAMPSA